MTGGERGMVVVRSNENMSFQFVVVDRSVVVAGVAGSSIVDTTAVVA
jgi:hypothetical protein